MSDNGRTRTGAGSTSSDKGRRRGVRLCGGGAGREEGRRGRGCICVSVEIRATLVDQVLNYGFRVAGAGPRVQPSVGRTTVLNHSGFSSTERNTKTYQGWANPDNEDPLCVLPGINCFHTRKWNPKLKCCLPLGWETWLGSGPWGLDLPIPHLQHCL